MRSCTSVSQWRDFRIWSGSEDLGAATARVVLDQGDHGRFILHSVELVDEFCCLGGTLR